ENERFHPALFILSYGAIKYRVMRKQPLFIISFVVSLACQSQNFSLTSSKDINNRKGSLYMNIAGAVKSDVYVLKVSNDLRGLGKDNGFDTYYSLCKFDDNLNMVFDHGLNKLIVDKIFQSLGIFEEHLYLFISDYKQKSFVLYGVELDKITGDKIGDLREVFSYRREDKWDQIDFTIKPNPDSSGFIVVGRNTNDEKFDDAYYVSLVDKSLANGGTLKINPPIDHKMQSFELENIVSEKGNSFLLFGKLFQGVEVKKNQLN